MEFTDFINTRIMLTKLMRTPIMAYVVAQRTPIPYAVFKILLEEYPERIERSGGQFTFYYTYNYCHFSFIWELDIDGNIRESRIEKVERENIYNIGFISMNRDKYI